MTIPDTELEAIEARCKAATPGPWEPNVWMGSYSCDWTATGPILEPDVDEVSEPGGPTEKQAQRDADFISNARTDLPKLIAAYRELRDALEISAPPTPEEWHKVCDERDAFRADKERLDWLAELSSVVGYVRHAGELIKVLDTYGNPLRHEIDAARAWGETK